MEPGLNIYPTPPLWSGCDTRSIYLGQLVWIYAHKTQSMYLFNIEKYKR